MTWQQLSFGISGDKSGAATELLEAFGAEAVTSQSEDGEDRFDLAEPSYKPWQQTHLTALYSADLDLTAIISALCDTFGMTKSAIEVSPLAEQDWERAWLEHFQPTRITDALWICPSWLQDDPAIPENATRVLLDPGLAFGTGTHATTALCLKVLSTLDLNNKTVLDFGCGSGILAIAALKLGAQAAMATDVDDKALTATRDNARLNGVEDRITVLSSAESLNLIQNRDKPADVVVANILADALVELNSTLKLALAEGGILIMSGILSHQQSLVKDAYPEFQFETDRHEDWIVLAARTD